MPTQTELSTRWLLTVGAIMSLCDDHRKGRCMQDVLRVCTNLQKECHEECQRQSENLSLKTLGRDTGRHRESLVLSHDRRVRDRVLAGKKRRGGRKRAQKGAKGRKRAQERTHNRRTRPVLRDTARPGLAGARGSKNLPRLGRRRHVRRARWQGDRAAVGSAADNCAPCCRPGR